MNRPPSATLSERVDASRAPGALFGALLADRPQHDQVGASGFEQIPSLLRFPLRSHQVHHRGPNPESLSQRQEWMVVV